MSKIFIAMIFAIMAGTAFAGIAYEPPMVKPTPDDGDATGALVLLALIGVVIASGTVGGLATRNKTTMLPEEPEDL